MMPQKIAVLLMMGFAPHALSEAAAHSATKCGLATNTPGLEECDVDNPTLMQTKMHNPTLETLAFPKKMHIQKIEGDRMELLINDDAALIPINLFEYDFFKTVDSNSSGLRHFKAEQGISARAQLSADGSLTGWFALDSGPVQITFDQTGNATSTMLLRTHTLPRQMALTEQQRSRVRQTGGPGHGLTKAVETVDEAGYTAFSVKADNALLNNNEMPDAYNWQGTPWFGGNAPCFPDDSSGRWIMKIGIMVDGKALQDTNWEQRVSAIVSAASIIYEKQMNIELQVAWTITANEGSNWQNPIFDAGCPFWRGTEVDNIDAQLDALKGVLANPSGSGTTLTESDVNAVVTTHLFTGCDDDGFGTVGVAGIATLGDPNSAGVVNLKSTWTTFAHELGHNFGAQHTFEPGSGGGIMDYDNGKTGGKSNTVGVGTFEFNALRQCQVCSEVSELRRKGTPGFFRKEGYTPAAASPVQSGLAAGCVCEDTASTGYNDNYGQMVTCPMAKQKGWCGESWWQTHCPLTCGICTSGPAQDAGGYGGYGQGDQQWW